MAIQLLQGLACTYNSWASTVANHSHQFSLKVGCFDSMWLRKQHWDLLWFTLHKILPTHYQYLQYHICKYLLLIHIEILGMDISWFDSVSWITRQLAHSLWASGHLRGDKGEGPGGNKITRFEVSGGFSKKQIMKIVFFLYVLLNMIHTWVMIIAVSAIRIMCNSLRDTCFRWISNTSWMERWMCSMVAAASGSLQSHQRSLQTSRLIVLVSNCDINTSAILESSLMIWKFGCSVLWKELFLSHSKCDEWCYS